MLNHTRGLEPHRAPMWLAAGSTAAAGGARWAWGAGRLAGLPFWDGGVCQSVAVPAHTAPGTYPQLPPHCPWNATRSGTADCAATATEIIGGAPATLRMVDASCGASTVSCYLCERSPCVAALDCHPVGSVIGAPAVGYFPNCTCVCRRGWSGAKCSRYEAVTATNALTTTVTTPFTASETVTVTLDQLFSSSATSTVSIDAEATASDDARGSVTPHPMSESAIRIPTDSAHRDPHLNTSTSLILSAPPTSTETARVDRSALSRSMHASAERTASSPTQHNPPEEGNPAHETTLSAALVRTSTPAVPAASEAYPDPDIDHYGASPEMEFVGEALLSLPHLRFPQILTPCIRTRLR